MKRIPEDWAIDWSDLKFLEKVGGGAFGTVYRGRLWGSVVAIKQLNASDGVTPTIKLALEKEISVLSKVGIIFFCFFLGCMFPANASTTKASPPQHRVVYRCFFY